MYRDRRVTFLLALVGIALTATCVWLAVARSWLAWAGVALFGGATLGRLAMAARKAPVLRIDGAGIEDLRYGLRVGWDEVTGVQIWEQSLGWLPWLRWHVPYLLVEVRSRESVLARVPIRRRFFSAVFTPAPLGGPEGVNLYLQDVRDRRQILSIVARFYRGPIEGRPT